MSIGNPFPAHWSPADETRFQEMRARRLIFRSTKRADVVRVWNDSFPSHIHINRNAATEDAIIDAIIENADAFRDALAPFDSGVRPARSGS